MTNIGIIFMVIGFLMVSADFVRKFYQSKHANSGNGVVFIDRTFERNLEKGERILFRVARMGADVRDTNTEYEPLQVIDCRTKIPKETEPATVKTIYPCGCWVDRVGNSEICEKHKKKSKEEVRKQ